MRLLALDGGGVRGALTASILCELEDVLDAPLFSRVDRISGTSVGAILACGIASGMTARGALEAILRLAPEVFPGLWGQVWGRLRRLPTLGFSQPSYEASALTRALLRVFDPDLRFGDLPIPVDVPAYDVREGQAWLLSSDREPEAQLPVYVVCQASASAPGYFPALSTRIGSQPMDFVDGGLGANCPAAVSIARAVRMTRTPLAEMVCVSVGTGASRFHIDPQEARSRGMLEWATDAVPAFMSASSSVHEHMAAWLLGPGRFLRVQVELPKEMMRMDQSDSAHLSRLVAIGRSHAQHGSVRLAASVLA